MATIVNVDSDHYRANLTATDRESNPFQLSKLMPRGNIRSTHGKVMMQIASSSDTSRLRLDIRAAPSMEWRSIVVRTGSGYNTFDAFPNAEYRLLQLETSGTTRVAGNITVVLRAD